MNVSPAVMKRRAFSLVELLICLSVFLTLTGGLFLAFAEAGESALVRRDIARLESWLASAMSRADRWRSDFTLSVSLPMGPGERHYATLKWHGGGLSGRRTEYFYADAKVKWRLAGNTRKMFYQSSTHSMSPAFELRALNERGKLSGDSLTVSLRGQITRRSGGKIM